MKSRLVVLVAAAAAAGLLAGCAGSSSSNKHDGSSGKAGGSIASAPGFDPSSNTINVGAILPLTGPQAGPAVLTGLDVFVKQLNASGGIDGKYKLAIKSYDNQFQVPLTLQGYNSLKDSTVMQSIVLGTPNVAALLPQLQKDQTVAVPVSNSTAFVHNPNLVPTQTTYGAGLIAAADYVIKKDSAKGKTWCAAQQDDAFGQPLAAAVTYAGQKLGFTVKKTATFAVTDTNLTAQVQQLKNSGCQEVFFNGVSGISQTMMTAAQQANFTPQWIVVQSSYVPAYASSPISSYLSQHWIVPAEGGVAWNDSTPGQKQLVANVKKYAPSAAPTNLIQWGYTCGMATQQVLEQAVKNGDLSHAGVLKALAEVQKLTFNKIIPDYDFGSSPTTRVAPSTVSILKVDPSAPGGLGTLDATFQSSTAAAYQPK